MVKVKRARKPRRSKKKRKRGIRGEGSLCGSGKRMLLMLVVLCVGTVARTAYSTHHHIHHGTEEVAPMFSQLFSFALRRFTQKVDSQQTESSDSLSSSALRGSKPKSAAPSDTSKSNFLTDSAPKQKAAVATAVRDPAVTTSRSAKNSAISGAATSQTLKSPPPTPQLVESSEITKAGTVTSTTAVSGNVGEACTKLAKKHKVKIGSSWGSLDSEQKDWWRRAKCDRELLTHQYKAREFDTTAAKHGISGSTLIGTDRKKAAAATVAAAAVTTVAPAPAAVGLVVAAASAASAAAAAATTAGRQVAATAAKAAAAMTARASAKVTAGASRFQPVDPAKCRKMQTQHRVVIDKTWGTLPKALQVEWGELRCDMLDAKTRDAVQKEVRAMSTYETRIENAIASRRPDERLARSPAPAPTPRGEDVVAIGVSSTTRGLTVGKSGDLSLFRLMLPSLVRTAEKGIEYWLYIAFDAGDRWWDNPTRLVGLRAEVDALVVEPLRTKGIVVRVAFLRYTNTMRKPGPVFNFMMGSAYEDGADYLYRINDDTEFKDAWATIAIAALKKRTPPNIGVVGPICKQGNKNILTHDMVHRKHMEIFRTYYPPVFSDWWMDDWITHVYGKGRTQWGPFEVIHHTNSHNTRYQVDYTHKNSLQMELRKGARVIERWIQKHPA